MKLLVLAFHQASFEVVDKHHYQLTKSGVAKEQYWTKLAYSYVSFLG
jgi:hypothetical protein